MNIEKCSGKTNEIQIQIQNGANFQFSENGLSAKAWNVNETKGKRRNKNEIAIRSRESKSALREQ